MAAKAYQRPASERRTRRNRTAAVNQERAVRSRERGAGPTSPPTWGLPALTRLVHDGVAQFHCARVTGLLIHRTHAQTHAGMEWYLRVAKRRAAARRRTGGSLQRAPTKSVQCNSSNEPTRENVHSTARWSVPGSGRTCKRRSTVVRCPAAGRRVAHCQCREPPHLALAVAIRSGLRAAFNVDGSRAKTLDVRCEKARQSKVVDTFSQGDETPKRIVGCFSQQRVVLNTSSPFGQ